MKTFSKLCIAVTIIADVCIMVYFNNWCANMPRTCLLWMHGAVQAYMGANFLGIIACMICSLPAIMAIGTDAYD